MRQEIATQSGDTSVENIQQKALEVLTDGSYLINKSYFPELQNCRIVPVRDSKLSFGADVRIFYVERIVLQNKQSALESLTAAYTALGAAGYSVFFFLDCDGQETKLYIGVRGEPGKVQGSTAGKLLQESLSGHFSGSKLVEKNSQFNQNLFARLKEKSNTSITSVSGVPSLSVDSQERFVQGLERFINAAEGHKYQAIILAEHVQPTQLNIVRMGYEDVASQISPLLKQQLSFGENESTSISESISKGLSQSLGNSLSLTETNGVAKTESTATSYGYSEAIASKSTSSKVLPGLAGGLRAVAMISGPYAPVVLGASRLVGFVANTFGETTTHSSSTSTSNTNSTSYNHSSSRGETKTQTDTRSINQTVTDGKTLGHSKQITMEFNNKHIEQLLKKIDQHLARVDEASRYGGWQSAAYFIGEDTASTETLASMFLGLMRGNDSNSENFALNTWKKDSKDRIIDWLCQLEHPNLSAEHLSTIPLKFLSPATLVSSKELALQLNLPHQSTSGTSVIECATFGRQIQRLDGEKASCNTSKYIALGKIHHLWKTLPQSVELDIDNLSSHLFITGSTGSGKSNTIYHMLNQLDKHNISFMVIEPAKGEYKYVFGGRDNVSVFTTNPSYGHLLKINPFCFPDSTHVLEHVDRLVEIFNVCWPMYSAMPAVLKESILNAYEECGWDLELSINTHGEKLFPTFIDLEAALENVIAQSAYSSEVKGNYIGALVTRIRSLTNGLNGQIFTADELDNALLFDSNVIIDLSRIGSQETKALIMGILVMRLNEYRMESRLMNQPVKHITVLEEAHNILRKTSTEQSGEGANIAGKSVEMLSNAIAEMRTYGEGFIIADQSPNAVDISAIRNTNTKIIMRLPDEADRKLVGKAAGLIESQLDEISRLSKGVAIVYQNDWLEAVLANVDKYEYQETTLCQQPISVEENSIRDSLVLLLSFLLQTRIVNNEYINPVKIKPLISGLPIKTAVKIEIYKAIDEVEKMGSSHLWKAKYFAELSLLIANIINISSKVQECIDNAYSAQYLSTLIQKAIQKKLGKISPDLSMGVIQSLLKERSMLSAENKNVYYAWRVSEIDWEKIL